MKVRHTLLLTLLLAAVLIARLAAFFHVVATQPDAMLAPDSPTYEQPARALLRWGRFAVSPETPNVPETRRTPGYPILIALVEAAAGPNRAAVIIAQIVLSLGTLALLFACARRVWRSRTAAWLAAALAALDPASFYYSQLMLSETLFTLLAVCMLYCGCRVARHGARRPGWAVLLGCSLALATHVRPVTYYLVFPLAVWLILALRRPGAGRTPAGGWGRAAGWMLVGVLPWIVLIGGWQARNKLVAGSAQFSQIENVNLYLYRAADVLALEQGVRFETMRERLTRQADQATAGMSDRDRYAFYRREAIAILKAHPLLVLQSWSRGLVRLLVHPGAMRLSTHLGQPIDRAAFGSDWHGLSFGAFARKWVIGRPLLVALALIEGFLFLAVYAGLPASLWLARRRLRARWRVHALWLGTLVYLIVLSSGPEAYARMRVPFMPILALYGGYFLWRLGRRRFACRRPFFVESVFKERLSNR